MDQATIYAHHAAEYDALVSAEDVDRRLLPAIAAVAPLAGARVIEAGAGTGRITRQLVAAGARVVGVDASSAMLDVARAHLEVAAPRDAWDLHCADARALPVPSGWANLGVAGWVFGHFRLWMPEGWRTEIAAALAEMDRALAPGGALVVVETLGTGREEPEPPSPALAEYYAWLEQDQGMTRAWIRTDYEFPDAATAARVTGFFFGEAFGERVIREGRRRIPECTGVWSRRARS
jgi:ubiquinone/menaquinone biosynthesis C-methylase UbiE